MRRERLIAGSRKLGKPFQDELRQLNATYRWALKEPVEQLAAPIRAASASPLIAVGSGGSFTTADVIASLHGAYSRCLATAITPLELAASQLDLRPMVAVLATAGGKNPDVLGSFRQLVHREPRHLILICMVRNSPLSRLAERYRFVDCASFAPPPGRDGFLATNSLLGSAVLLSRAYGEAFGIDEPLPQTIRLLSELERDPIDSLDLYRRCRPLWERRTMVVLYGPATRSAAIDLESKFTEAALGNVQIADYRHFAHGRHHWLAKHASDTSVLAFVTPSDEPIATKTVSLIPSSIPLARIDVPDSGSAGIIHTLAYVLAIVSCAGRTKGIDPGRPGVPGFGRRIYHLNAFDNRRAALNSPARTAIERKARRSIEQLEQSGELGFWKTAFETFTKRLSKPSFRAIVFDYDGTLCDTADRLKGCPRDIGREITKLIRANVLVGIATGRGKSVRLALRERIPKKYWGRVVVGYYNGGDVGLLSEDSRPDGRENVSDILRPLVAVLRSNARLVEAADFELRLRQIKVEPKQPSAGHFVGPLVEQLVYSSGIDGLRVVHSRHSVDILAPGVTKEAVVDRLLSVLELDDEPVLCIGDLGQWPGNDCDLLHLPFSVSADEVSQDATTCWNLAPPGHRGTQATLGYLQRLQKTKNGFRFTLPPRTTRPL